MDNLSAQPEGLRTIFVFLTSLTIGLTVRSAGIPATTYDKVR